MFIHLTRYIFAAGHILREVRRPVAGRFENERITETNVCFWAKGVALLICGMAFLFASCSEYKVLETTEVFKIEKTSSEVHVYLRNGYAVRIDPNDRWNHYFINENRERVKFYDPEVLLWQNAEPGWVVEVYGEYQSDYLRLVPPADITEELEVASISVYEGETGRFLGYLSGGLLTSPSGKFDFQSYQGKILTNVLSPTENLFR